MSLTQDEKNEIRRENPAYPRVSRTTDPMVVRIDKTSLLVNDTMFTAKLKCGLGYKGYLIYSSGLGTPIYEKAAKTSGEWQKSFSTVGNRPYNIAFDSENTSQLTNVLTAAAKEWLDDLEIAIADRENDNAIKKAIDRLCWQLHYDITESHTDFAKVFKDNDFSDVKIDTGNGKTVNKSIEDNYTTISTSVTDGSSTISGGSSLQGVENSISSFDGNLCGKFETFNGKFDTFNGKFESFNGKFDTFDNHFTAFNTSLNGSLKTIGTKLVPDDTTDTTNDKYYSISECLRDAKNGSSEQAYSVAKSLREIGQTSVSQATHEQTTLESTHFTDIEGRVGNPGDGNSIWGTVYNMNGGATQVNSLYSIANNAMNYASSADGNATTSANNTSTIITSIACNRGNIGTLVNDMYEGMWGNGTDVNGFISKLNASPKTYYIKAAASAGGITW